jgi:hypothetical protein
MAPGGGVAPPIVMNLLRGEDLGEMLLESEARFFRDAGGVGIDGLEKAPDFRLDLLMAEWGDLRWLDMNVHFPLHPLRIPREHSSASKRKPATRIVVNTPPRGKFRLGGN